MIVYYSSRSKPSQPELKNFASSSIYRIASSLGISWTIVSHTAVKIGAGNHVVKLLCHFRRHQNGRTYIPQRRANTQWTASGCPSSFLGDKIEMGGLCGFELLQQSLCCLAHKIFKKRGLIRVIAVEGALREARLRDNLIQRCVLEALFQEFFFPTSRIFI